MTATKMNTKDKGKKADTTEVKPVYVPPKIGRVIVHPLVLLSVVDHYNRLNKIVASRNRVVGVLLGEQRGTALDISNSFAVPFEEDYSDSKVWFLDHDYVESMFSMFEKVNARERIVGWYHSGPKLCANDIMINELFRKFAPESVLVVVDIKRDESDGLPTEAYIAVDEIHDDGSPTTKTFDRLNCQIDAEEAEEIGIEHLLRDIKDTTLGTLSQRVSAQLDGLQGLLRQLQSVDSYLELVSSSSSSLPINHNIIYQLQDIFNLLPDLHLGNTLRSLHVTTNDEVLVVYVAAVMRSILALHDLIGNKLANRETERNEEDSITAGDGKRATTDAPADGSKGGGGKGVDESGTGETKGNQTNSTTAKK